MKTIIEKLTKLADVDEELYYESIDFKRAMTLKEAIVLSIKDYHMDNLSRSRMKEDIDSFLNMFNSEVVNIK